MRRPLSNIVIREIYIGYLSNEPKLAIARRLDIDRTTVYNHLRRIAHLSEERVVSLISSMVPHQCANGHTSMKCLVCGISSDNIRSEQFQEIIRLRRRVAELETQLKTRDEVHSRQHSSNPIVTVSE